MIDRHAFFLEVDDDWVALDVECPYDAADESRPCWPHHEASEENGDTTWLPDDPPQTMCTFSDWVANTGFDEMAHGQVRLALPGAWFDWSNGDYPILQLARDPAKATAS